MQLAKIIIKDVYLPAQNKDFSTLGGFVSSFLPKVLIAAGVIFFFLTILAGIGVIAGAGNDDAHAQEKAKSFMTYAVIGMVIIFASYWILQIINFVTFNSLQGIVK